MKEKIKNTPWLYLLLKIFKNRKNNDYISSHFDLDHNMNTVKLIKNDSSKNKDVYCKIVAGGKNDGFFASIRWALDALYFCDYYSLKPIVKFHDESLYYDKDYSKNNPFENYFNQPLGFSSSKLNDANTIIEITEKNYLLAESLNDGINYKVTEKYINEMAKIMKKYLSFNDDTKYKIDSEIKKRKIDASVLGVHIRGTDYKKNYKNHPMYIDCESYYNFIDNAIKQYDFKKIFLATDDEEILEQMIEHYGKEKIIYAEDTKRGKGNIGVHVEKSKRKFNKYLLGLEVIFDMCSLAACGGIISGMSQVGLSARIYKKSQNKEYIYDKIIDQGINKNGKNFKI